MELIEPRTQRTAAIRVRTWWDERGSSVIEYVLLVALIAIVCLIAMQFLGTSTSGRLSSVASQVTAA